MQGAAAILLLFNLYKNKSRNTFFFAENYTRTAQIARDTTTVSLDLWSLIIFANHCPAALSIGPFPYLL